MEPFEKIKLSFKCPKALNELQPCHDNWYCEGCEKMVYDFRGMSEEAILDAFAKSKTKLCGIYDANRIEVINHWPKWFRLASAALMALGVSALNSCSFGQKHTSDSIAISQNTEKIPILGMPMIVPEISPKFPGGEEAFKKYMHQHIKNTTDFRGRAFVQFVVEKDGSLTDIKIVRSAGKVLDDQIIKALKHSPKWKPGSQSGKTARVQYIAPVNFALNQ